jgi:hypothetical protein
MELAARNEALAPVPRLMPAWSKWAPERCREKHIHNDQDHDSNQRKETRGRASGSFFIGEG